MESLVQHLMGVKGQKISSLYTAYRNAISNDVTVSVDPSKITPSVSSVKVRGGYESAFSLEVFCRHLRRKGLNKGELINLDIIGAPAYMVEIDEYERIVDRMEDIACEHFVDYCKKQALVGAATTVEEVFAV
jgi:hypothetical protein